LAVRCFNWAYRAADELIVIGRDMEEVVRRKVGDGCCITQIPNWADVDAVTPAPKAENELVRAHGLQDRTVFLFAGNLGRVQGIENLLKAIERTRTQSAAFLFVGDGALQPQIEKFIHDRPDKKVLHLGRLPMSAQQSFLNACDVAFVTLDDAMYGLGVPSKSYFTMAAGKPLLLVADRDSEIGRVIREEEIGWIVPPNMPDALARKIDEICSMPGLEKIGNRAREVVERRFSEQVILSRYSQYFKQLLGQNGTEDSPVGEQRQEQAEPVLVMESLGRGGHADWSCAPVRYEGSVVDDSLHTAPQERKETRVYKSA
jgi:glycosyltransferase involved in cell wall biosynthesis